MPKIKQSKEFSNQSHNAQKDIFDSAKVRNHHHYKIKTNHSWANTPETHKAKPLEIKHNKQKNRSISVTTPKQEKSHISSEKKHPTYSEVFQADADQEKMHPPEFPSSSLKPF